VRSFVNGFGSAPGKPPAAAAVRTRRDSHWETLLHRPACVRNQDRIRIESFGAGWPGLGQGEGIDMAGRDALKIARSPARPQSTGRREQIIDAALTVMISNGVYNTTTRKIAEAAGVNVATLHYHFHNKEEIIFSAMEELASRYRNTLSARFTQPQTLHDRMEDLLWFIWGEIRQAPGEQLVLQEMTLYVLRVSGAEHLAAQKEREIKSLYSASLRDCRDVGQQDAPQIEQLTDFIYACFVGILNQWLATKDESSLVKTTGNLIEAAQALAGKLLPHGSQ
jgi:AcrR family transcriptional regulator